jgi:hypothetical protein
MSDTCPNRQRRLPAGLVAIAAITAIGMLFPHAGAADCDPTRIFGDDFESGNDLAWGQGSAAIAAARVAADGAVTIEIAGLVTFVRPDVGTDSAGFFVQAETAGPALFVMVDPVLLAPVPVAGDGVYFTVDSMFTHAGGARIASAISGFGRSQQERCLDTLIQDVSFAVDLVSGLDGYETELVALSGIVTGAFAASGTGFVWAEIDTAGISGDSDLRLRLPTTLHDESDIAPGCAFDLPGTPLWRFLTTAEPSAWRPEELSLASCPEPTVLGALATSATTVEVTFDRRIDPASLTDAATQFAFDGGLTASAAVAAARKVTVTTSVQSAAADYSIEVAQSVTDLLGASIDNLLDTASFTGFD